MVGRRRRRTQKAWQLDGDGAGGIGTRGRRGWNRGALEIECHD
jgi:hypothetical protein